MNLVFLLVFENFVLGPNFSAPPPSPIDYKVLRLCLQASKLLQIAF